MDIDKIVPENIEDIKIDDGITFKYDHTSRAGKVIEVTDKNIVARNAVGDKYTIKFEQIEMVYRGYYKSELPIPVETGLDNGDNVSEDI